MSIYQIEHSRESGLWIAHREEECAAAFLSVNAGKCHVYLTPSLGHMIFCITHCSACLETARCSR